MPLNFSTAPALFLGLGARLLLDFLSRLRASQPPPPPSFSDFILLGAWQGVGLYYALVELPNIAIIIVFAIAAKLFFDFMQLPDLLKIAVTVLGIVLGVMCTDVLSQFLEDGEYTSFGGKKRRAEPVASSSFKRTRTVSFSRKDSKGKDTSRREKNPGPHSDITAPSLDSTIDWIDRTARTPLDREVATLRARASLADTEKRRYKEERIWALASGNQARADQMAWQVKRYRALTHGFHKEADRKLLEANSLNFPSTQPAQSTSRTSGPVGSSSRIQTLATSSRAQAPINSSSRIRTNSGSSMKPIPVPPPRADPGAIDPPDWGGPTYTRRRRTSSGNLKSSLRSGGSKYG
ncbi:hypothetical protein HWV62_9013 [Athelia sp. TMB]|nr:hypothetical protein HWV62_9013 [Athelia sp. TMB]